MTSTKHYVFSAFPAWGHIRSFCILGARLVKEDENAVVTIIIDSRMLDKAHDEISAELRSGQSQTALQRIRVLATYQSDTYSVDVIQIMKSLAESYGPAYQALMDSKPVTCAAKGTVFDAVAPPNVVILDFFALPQLHVTRAITGKSVPIFAWITGHASSIIRTFGPESMGGIGNLAKKIAAEAARTGATPEEIGDKVFKHTDGTIVKIPGLPAMYDYEFFPQKLPFEIPVSMVIGGCHSFLEQCDGVLITSTYHFEREALEAVKSWFSSWNKPTYVIGPLLPSGFGTIAQTPRGADDIEEFLDKAVTKHGQKSVLFISFGTFFYPASPEYVEELFEALIEKNFPFIFCYASPFAKLSDELINKATSSGLGLITKWAPQQYILSHPATGWFLSHCGHNGVMESLACGIPIIAWPFEADQPGAAAHLTENLDVAFELIEVRTGDKGLKPLRRNGRAPKGTREAVGAEIRGVTDACRGRKGEKMKYNAEDMKEKFADAWKGDGISRKELHEFIEKHV
ncbi:UDP-Glycosyltransferase/glycogen phosphorylase [Gymnopilus junonius]|uniref:UDP-Glycosyltransferase/glycogen phosphorylase n=1 Tax=Gymnopilus junonius TaxID=109634 RepID=A0A9P5TNM0_GYMJU|nr:UDP-Glycosyltransferase/glycogen phosphorylase [Gymnopilus junonius]